MGEFAEPFAAIMVSELMGFAPKNLERLKQWSAAYVGVGFTFGREFVNPVARHAVAQLKHYLNTEMIARHHAPRCDLISAMLGSYCQQNEFTDQHIVNTCLLFLTAGMQTTKHAICNTIAALIEHPGAFSQLVADQKLLPLAVEECFRYDGPSQAVGRVTTTDIELSGVKLTRGAFLRLALASANRDAEQFYHPDQLDIRRQPNRHVAFGSGSHMCLGGQVARLTTRVAIRGLLQRFRGFSIVPDAAIREQHSSLRGFVKLQVICHRH